MEKKKFRSVTVNGYSFGDFHVSKANYKRMNPYSKTILALMFIANKPDCERKEVNHFIHGENKYSQYSSFIWKNIIADELVEKKRTGNTYVYSITEKGKLFLNDFLKEHYKKIDFNFG
jgi:predicted transcriptional regulator